MSSSLLEKIERDLDKIGVELWEFDGPESALDKIFKKLSSLKVQVGVQKSLQTTTNLLRQHPVSRALPKQQATRVKHLIRFVFKSRRGDRHKQLRAWDCNALKFLGLSYSTEEIVKMEDAEFEFLRNRGPEFFRRRELVRLLYRPEVDRAVGAVVEDLDDDGTYDKFIQDHTNTGLQLRKRKYDDVESSGAADSQVAKTGPSQEEQPSTKPAKYGDVFSLSLEDAQWALSCRDKVTDVFLTTPLTANVDGKKPPFMTTWFTEDFSESLPVRMRDKRLKL